MGKTSCSIGVALMAAQRGLRVGLLSIDPAKRLAAALGMSFGSKPKRLDLPGVKGSVDAAMIDQKAIFDRMVKRYAKDPALAHKILTHKLYIAASTKIAGSLEYMALASLQEMVETESYDLIVFRHSPRYQRP